MPLVLKLEVPDDHIDRVYKAVLTNRWTPTIPGDPQEDGTPTTVPNPVSKDEFVTQTLANYLNQMVSDYEQQEAMRKIQEQGAAAPVIA